MCDCFGKLPLVAEALPLAQSPLEGAANPLASWLALSPNALPAVWCDLIPTPDWAAALHQILLGSVISKLLICF